MNRLVRCAVEVPTGFIKTVVNNVVYRSKIKYGAAMSPSSELTVHRGGKLEIGKCFRARSGCKIRVWKSGALFFGSNVSVNHGCMICCRKEIRIGNDVQFSPNVLIYDHDHDYRAPGGVKDMRYVETPVLIGDNVWIGANAVILRGTVIGDNAVIAAGSVVKGIVPPNTLFYNKRVNEERSI